METVGKKIPARLTLFNIPLACTCDSKQFFNKYSDRLEYLLQSKVEDLSTIDKNIHERVDENERAKVCHSAITGSEETDHGHEVCKLPAILELPEEAEVSKQHVDEHPKIISFSENIEILQTSPVSSSSVNTHDTTEEIEIFPHYTKHKDHHVTIVEDSDSETIKTILKPTFKDSILSFDTISEDIFDDDETNVDKTTNTEEEIIQITNKEYLRKYNEIQQDINKIKNMLVIIEEKINASSSGIEEILLEDLKRNMDHVKELYNMVQLKEVEIEKIEHISKHIQDRRRSDLELWIVIQDLSISIELLPIKPTKHIPRQILKHDEHQKRKKPSTPRLKTFETIEERLYKMSHGQFSSQTEEEEGEGMYDKYSEKDFYRFLPYSDISQEDISREDTTKEDLSKDKFSERDDSFLFTEKSEEYNPFMKQAKYYLQSRRIKQFFKFLGAHLTAASPANPIQYLIDLLHQCLEYRNGRCMPPLLFEQRHIESLYHALDPIGLGEITMDQYCTGLFTLGVPNFTQCPGVNEHLMVNKETFINDASTKLKEHLDAMLYIPDQSIFLSPDLSSRISSCRSG